MRNRGNGSAALENNLTSIVGDELFTTATNTTRRPVNYNCTLNVECETECCLQNNCIESLLCSRSYKLFDTMKILYVMIIAFIILLAIAYYVRYVSKRYAIKATGAYAGKHTYLTRKSHLNPERLITGGTIKLKRSEKNKPDRHEFKLELHPMHGSSSSKHAINI